MLGKFDFSIGYGIEIFASGNNSLYHWSLNKDLLYYYSTGSAAFPTEGTTNLHIDMSDAVNIMVGMNTLYGILLTPLGLCLVFIIKGSIDL